MTMLDGLKVVFLEALSFADCKSREMLVKKWNEQCEEVYKYKNALIEEEHKKAVCAVNLARTDVAREIFAVTDILGTYNPAMYDELKKKYTGADEKPFPRTHENGGGWISVEDRLPEIGTDVIGYSEKKNRCFVVAYSDTYRCFFSGQFPNDDITHWMFLPELPKMKGE